MGEASYIIEQKVHVCDIFNVKKIGSTRTELPTFLN